MTRLSAYEQLLLELVNRARLDPSTEAARYGIRLNQDLPPGTLFGTIRQPLAPNEFLRDAAHDHSAWMLDRDVFTHTGAGGSFSWDRMSAAGYTFAGTWNAGENIAWLGTTATFNLTAYTFRLHENIFLSPDHRFMMLKDEFREMGPGIATGRFSTGGTIYNAAMATENFAQSGSDVFITGVAINDRDGDNFYDVGEGRSGVTARVSDGALVLGSGTTAAAGGYGVQFKGGLVDVTFSGAGLNHVVNVAINAGAHSAKVDLSGTNKILSSASAELGTGAVRLVLLGAAALNGTGNGEDNVITGNRSANRLDGQSGDDVLIGAKGRDVLTGGDGSDRFDFNSLSDSRVALSISDHITDFEIGFDKIDVSTIDANVRTEGNQAFKWIGSGAFNHVSGELRGSYSGGDVILSGDVNGDGHTDFRIILDDASKLSKSDFIL